MSSQGTAGQLLISGGGAAPTWTSTFPGVPPAPLTAGGVVYGTGSAVAVSAPGTAGQVLVSQGAGAPIWSSSTGSSISQGDSKVEVTDTGSNGKINFTCDNVDVADFNNGIIVFNNTGADQDFRIEGDTNTNLFFVDASTDRIGIGTSTPVSTLEINSFLPIVTWTDNNDSAASRIFQDDSKFQIDVDFANTKSGTYLAFNTDGSEKARLNGGGELLIGTTSTTANGGLLQLASGITFPATQVAATNANTLDDYEEGTWTPTITGSTSAGTATYATRVGRYTKIGNIVQYECYISYSSGTGTGDLRVTGLPFTSSSSYYAPAACTLENITLTANNYAVPYVQNSNTYVAMAQNPTGGGARAGIPYDVAGEIMLQGTYSV
jgi:hypothetical protein